MPKRGFNNSEFEHKFDVVNLDVIERHFAAGETVSLAVLESKGILHPVHGRLKVLGDGELKKKLTIVAEAASASARQKVEAAGSRIEGLLPPKKRKRSFFHAAKPAAAGAKEVPAVEAAAPSGKGGGGKAPGADKASPEKAKASEKGVAEKGAGKPKKPAKE
jgi:hypothetical protein